MTTDEQIDFCRNLKRLYERAAKASRCERRKRRFMLRVKQFELMIEKLSK